MVPQYLHIRKLLLEKELDFCRGRLVVARQAYDTAEKQQYALTDYFNEYVRARSDALSLRQEVNQLSNYDAFLRTLSDWMVRQEGVKVSRGEVLEGAVSEFQAAHARLESLGRFLEQQKRKRVLKKAVDERRREEAEPFRRLKKL